MTLTEFAAKLREVAPGAFAPYGPEIELTISDGHLMIRMGTYWIGSGDESLADPATVVPNPWVPYKGWDMALDEAVEWLRANPGMIKEGY